MRPVTFHFYRLEDGAFIGRSLTLATDTNAEAFVSMNTPDGCGALRHDGPLDVEASRVDVATGAVVEYQPQAPSPDHEWHAAARRWALKPAAAERRDRRAVARARLDAIDRESIRALRAVAAGTDTKADRDRLAALEAEAVPLRSKVNP